MIVENSRLGLRSLLEQILYCDPSVHSEKGTYEWGLATQGQGIKEIYENEHTEGTGASPRTRRF